MVLYRYFPYRQCKRILYQISLFVCLNSSCSYELLFLKIWNLKPGWGSRPDIYVANAHSDDITGVKFSSDGRILLSRSFDGSLKVLVKV